MDIGQTIISFHNCISSFKTVFNQFPRSGNWFSILNCERKKKEKNVSNPKQPNFGALYLTQFLTDFGQILDSKSNDQAQQTL